MPTPIAAAEIKPGLVVHLDADLLRKAGGCLTNMDVQGNNSPVTGPHYFLILTDADASGLFLAVPLFSDRKPGSSPLNDQEKTGPAKDWIGPQEKSYFSKYQHWKIPTAAMISASGNDDGIVGTRRQYGLVRPASRKRIVQAAARNRKKNFDPV